MNNYKHLSSLSDSNKIQLLKKEGTHLTTRTYNFYYIKLYKVKNCYVEVWSSSHVPWQDISKIKVLANYKLLKPYVNTELLQRMSNI